jgi:acyl-CoA synthetase (AMP-forming)/AMP-acid ligase II
MIASAAQATDGNRLTLDDLFRHAGVRHADAIALADPVRNFTFTQADRAISAMAARLRAIGLATDTVVALQLPNTIESVTALLGILRAGMIAAPLPLLWRQQEMVAALSRAGAKAIVTFDAQADTAVQVAAELFPIRAVCGFGRDLPDGVAPLDDVLISKADFFQPFVRADNAAAHVAAMTFDVIAGGIVPVAHSHSELMARGLDVFREAALVEDSAVLSTIPASSFAGISLTVMSWLLGGGTLVLHPRFDPAVFGAQCRAHEVSTVVLPGPALPAMADAGLLNAAKTILALWRTPEQLAAAPPWQGSAAPVDVAGFSETGLLAFRRAPDGLPRPSLTTAAPSGPIAVGGYRFRTEEIDAAVAAADQSAIIAALPHALLGQRLAGSAPYPADVAAALQARGVNALIAGAFRPRGKAA